MDTPNGRTANWLAELRRTPRKMQAIPEALRPQTLTQAYAVQERLVAELGGATIGYKTACTSALAREQLQVPHPLFGRLLSSSTYVGPVALRAEDFTLRTIEPEFAFHMRVDVPASDVPYTAETIARFVGTALPGIEIVDHRFEDWSAVGAPSIAADNAIHGAWVRGAEFAAWRALDLVSHEVTLRVDGQMVRTGTGAAVLGSPLHALAWLANELPRFGLQSKAGEFVTTGVVCDVYPASAGETIRADFGVLGSVELCFK